MRSTCALDRGGLFLDGARLPAPANGAELLAVLRAALAAAPRPQPEANGIPLAGGLVGYASYDIVRMFERLPSRRPPATTPLMHYVAPASLLVFDHVTRGIALLHAGPEAERASLRREVSLALQGGLPARSRPRGIRPAAPLDRPRPLPRRGAASPGAHRGRRHLPAGALHLLRGPALDSIRSRSIAPCARSIRRPISTSARSTT